MNPSTEPAHASTQPYPSAPDIERDQDEAIIKSICYSDIFGFPLTPEEIARFAQVKITPEQAADRLTNNLSLRKIVKERDGYYFIDGREGNVGLRQEREAESKKQLRTALKRLIPIQGIPFLRMAAITGALAAFNSPAGDDIDLLIITSRSRTWTAYLSLRLWRRFGHNPDVCFNIFLTEGDLVFHNENLFFAREILGSLPVFNNGAFEDFVGANPWVFDVFPSFFTDRTRQEYKLPLSPRWLRRQRRLEFLLTGPLGDLLELLARKMQSRILINAAPDAAMNARRNRIKLHKHDNRSPILDRYEQRCRECIDKYRKLTSAS